MIGSLFPVVVLCFMTRFQNANDLFYLCSLGKAVTFFSVARPSRRVVKSGKASVVKTYRPPDGVGDIFDDTGLLTFHVQSRFFPVSPRRCPQVKLVPAEALESTRKAFETVTSVHVYSIQAAPATAPVDAGAQVGGKVKKMCFSVFATRFKQVLPAKRRSLAGRNRPYMLSSRKVGSVSRVV